MDTSDILRKVRKIEIKTRGLSQNIFAGSAISTGMLPPDCTGRM